MDGLPQTSPRAASPTHARTRAQRLARLLPLLLFALAPAPSAGLPLARSVLPSHQVVSSLNDENMCRSLKVPVVPLGWLYGDKLGPPNINSEEELNQIGPYVAPLLYGGL